VLVDNLSRLLGLVLSPGQASDHKHAPALAEEAISEAAQMVMGDKGYDSDALRKQLSKAGIEPVIPFRKCRKVHQKTDHERYKERNKVERFIGKLKENRRVATRYDKKASHFAGFVTLAAIKMWLKIIC
jgi:transposase